MNEPRTREHKAPAARFNICNSGILQSQDTLTLRDQIEQERRDGGGVGRNRVLVDGGVGRVGSSLESRVELTARLGC